MPLNQYYAISKGGEWWVRVVAHIKCAATGEVRRYECENIWDTDAVAPHIYIWEEGNYFCDCNRALFLAQAFPGNDREKDAAMLAADAKCGTGGYLVNLENPKTGEIIYKEF